MLFAITGLADAAALPWTKALSRSVLQACVVVLGLGLSLHELARAGGTGIAFALGTIVLTFAAGYALGSLLGVGRSITTLLSSGTAICGGSAIAAVSGVIAASSAEIAVATGVVFLLNAAGLYLLPWLGELMHLSHAQFGVWSAISIHDVSSVVGASGRFKEITPPPAEGADAQTIATAVKLARALWIAPICLVIGISLARPADRKAARGSPVPLFILLFVVASAARTLFPQIGPAHADWIKPAATHGMAFALFLIGLGLSRKTLASVGWRALVLGTALWVIISAASLAVVRLTIA
jgi:uncharacterized integral membrane protein (TIGR00698 family)